MTFFKPLLMVLAGGLLCGCTDGDQTELDNSAPETQVTPKAAVDSFGDDFDDDDDFTSIAAQIAAFKWAEPKHGEALIEPIPIFFGDVNNDGAADMVAIISAHVGVSGHIVEPTVFIKEGEEFTPYEELGPISGVQPRDVEMSHGRIKLITTVPVDGDANCCPSGAKSWTLDLDFYEDIAQDKD